jgi:hypothetical protein
LRTIVATLLLFLIVLGAVAAWLINGTNNEHLSRNVLRDVQGLYFIHYRDSASERTSEVCRGNIQYNEEDPCASTMTEIPVSSRTFGCGISPVFNSINGSDFTLFLFSDFADQSLPTFESGRPTSDLLERLRSVYASTYTVDFLISSQSLRACGDFNLIIVNGRIR